MKDICGKCVHQKVCMFEMKYHGVVKAVEDAFNQSNNPTNSDFPFSLAGIDCMHYLEGNEPYTVTFN